MPEFKSFTGINNVQPQHRLKDSELSEALNVGVGLSGEVCRRQGYTKLTDAGHTSLHQAPSFLLAVVGGDLVRTDGSTSVLVQAGVGSARMWYTDLPDGRTAFGNGSVSGITDGTTTTGWGVPVPPSIGALTDVVGELFPGDYQYAITYVRLVDGLESGPAYSNPLPVADGGVLLTGLPVLAGHAINVYLSGQNGGEMYLAGTTLTSSFSYLGKSSALTLPCRTDFLRPMPKGTVSALWRGRVLMAEGNVLWASRPHQYELCDMRRDYKQLSGQITLIQPVDQGVYVGTDKSLVFLAGQEFDKLVHTPKADGAVVLGSGVAVPGHLIKYKDTVGPAGDAMVCIADGYLAAGFSDGTFTALTKGRYATDVGEVWATFREVDGVPQYVAIPK